MSVDAYCTSLCVCVCGGGGGGAQGTTDRRWDVEGRRKAGVGYLETVVP